MRNWEDLYADYRQKVKPTSTKVIDKLKISAEADYTRGVFLQREYQKHLMIEKSMKQKSTVLKPVISQGEVAKPVTQESTDIEVCEEETLEKLKFYLDPILSSSMDRVVEKEDFYYYLPSLNGSESLYFLMRILYALSKEKKDFMSMISDASLEERQEILDEVERICQRIQYIHEYLNPEGFEDSAIYTECNRLIFLETANGNACCLSDLKAKDVPNESYLSFLRLFRSIQDGSFQRIKKLETDASLYEVKDGSSRVVFTRVYKNYYCVLTAFIKKSLWEKELRQNLLNVTNNYLSQKSQIYQQLEMEDTEYISRQESFEKQLFSFLNGSSLEGGKEKCLK